MKDFESFRTDFRKRARRAMFMRIGLFAVLIAAGVGLLAFLSFTNEQTQRHTVQSIDKVENTHGSSDGFSTEVYYIVTTDKGIYRIEMSGFNAHPECAAVKKDSTYVLTTRGYNFPFLGMYSAIIHYQPVKD